MPSTPAKKQRLRSYDPAKTRAAVLAQTDHVREALRALTPGQLALPTSLGDWTVHELVAHLTMVVGTIGRAIEGPAPLKQELALLKWPFATVKYAGDISEDTRGVAASAPDPDALFTLFDRTAVRVAELLAATPDDRLVAARPGAMRLGDFLVSRTVELTVHTDDLNRATGLTVPLDRQALASCTRLLADALAAKAPGGSVEVRIPPYAVVQCVEGPRHTRGTPPNVVETDPLTWLRLATGRVGWAEARGEAWVSASGERADLSQLLPILG